MSDMIEGQRSHKLLRALDTLVQKDGGTTELDGVVVVVVKAEGSASVWHAMFDGNTARGCGYLHGVPRDADAILLFDEGQASDVIDGKQPRGKVATFGDHDLLDAFIDRYCTFRSFVDVRKSS